MESDDREKREKEGDLREEELEISQVQELDEGSMEDVSGGVVDDGGLFGGSGCGCGCGC